MDNTELFVDSNNLPKPLPKKECYELLDRAKCGDELARISLIEHNIRLVIHLVIKKFKTEDYDKAELVSVGNIGLMKAIKYFDTSRNIEFSSYASRCIYNEILMFLRKNKKNLNLDSIDRIMFNDDDDQGLEIKDILDDGTDLVEDYITKEKYKVIRNVVNELSGHDREVIILYFGFFENNTHSQEEISKKLKISQSYVSRVLKNTIKKIAYRLEEENIIELSGKNITNTPQFKIRIKRI